MNRNYKIDAKQSSSDEFKIVSMSSHPLTNVRPIHRPEQPSTENNLREVLLRWFTPRQEVQVVASQSNKGVFIPWPLLAIIVTLAIVLVSGLVTLQVQVSNLSTTLLLRDADHARQVQDIKVELAKEGERRELTDLKLGDLREKHIRLEEKLKLR